MLFCDIDGVISVFGFEAQAPPRGLWTQVDGIAHLLSADATAHLKALARRFEIVWCSGWEERANDHLPHLLGLGPYRHLRLPALGDGTRHWKLAAVEAAAGDRPAAWIDDDLDERCRAWAGGRPHPTLLVITDPAVGLDDSAAARLAAFAEAHGG